MKSNDNLIWLILIKFLILSCFVSCMSDGRYAKPLSLEEVTETRSIETSTPIIEKKATELSIPTAISTIIASPTLLPTTFPTPTKQIASQTFLLLEVDGETMILNPFLPEETYQLFGRNDDRLANPKPVEISPSGKYVLLTDTKAGVGKSRLYVMDIRDGKIFQLLQQADSQVFASWHPYKDQIVFVLATESGSRIYKINIDGTDLELLGGGHQWDRYPMWAKNGGEIVFISSSIWEPFTVPETDIYMMKENGDNLRKLTSEPIRMSGMALSPDGLSLAFSAPSGEEDIFVMDFEGGNVTRVTNHPSRDTTPVWSADSSRIVFQSSRDGNWEIYSMKTDGTDLIQLTDHPAFDAPTAWSPYGDYLAFASERSGTRQIYLMFVNDMSIKQVTNAQNYVYLADIWGEEKVEANPPPSYINMFEEGNVLSITEEGGNLNLRRQPSLQGEIITRLQPGDEVSIIEGPKFDDGYSWWKVEVKKQEIIGWVAEVVEWFEPGDER